MYDLQKERENVTDDREIDIDRFVCFFLPVSILSIVLFFIIITLPGITYYQTKTTYSHTSAVSGFYSNPENPT